eukprot:2121998-Pyramimonas_sp.AAC.1
MRPTISGKRCRNVFVAGPLPGAVYGREISGVSDHELLSLRQLAGKALKPSAGGRSLTALMLCHGDPPWVASIAPVYRWAKEVWTTHHRLHPHALSFATLRSSWNAVFSRPSGLWKSVAGPISAMRKSLERISWSMPSFT